MATPQKTRKRTSSALRNHDMAQRAKSTTCELADMGDVDEICRVLECPTCLEVPLPPIYLCASGHHACSTCVPKMKNCPLCKAEFTKIRNIALEGIINASQLYCKYASNGCPNQIRGDRLAEHVRTCPYRHGAILLPPKKDAPSPKGVIQGCCVWQTVALNQALPETVVDGGFIIDGEQLVIGRLAVAGCILPGGLQRTSRYIQISSKDGYFNKIACEVLTAVPEAVKWEVAVGGNIPEHAVIGGRTELGQAVYIGRCGHEESLYVGWINKTEKKLRFHTGGDGNGLFTSTVFEVLVKTDFGQALDLSIR